MIFRSEHGWVTNVSDSREILIKVTMKQPCMLVKVHNRTSLFQNKKIQVRHKEMINCFLFHTKIIIGIFHVPVYFYIHYIEMSQIYSDLIDISIPELPQMLPQSVNSLGLSFYRKQIMYYMPKKEIDKIKITSQLIRFVFIQDLHNFCMLTY